MRIEQVRVHGARSTKLALVEVVADDAIGIGCTSAPAGMIEAIINGPGGLVEALRGRDATRPAERWDDMFRGWQGRRGRAGEGGLAVNAMAAVDIALWDLAAKVEDQPLHRLLGRHRAEPVTVYGSATAFDFRDHEGDGVLGRKSDPDLVAEAREIVSDGFGTLKFGWGNRYDEAAMDVLRQVRQAIGPDVGLALDFGCPAYWTPGWDAESAVSVSARLAEIGLAFWEEPLAPFDVDGFATLTRDAAIPIATGESLTTVHEFDRLLAVNGAHVLQPDAAQIGITQFLRVVDRAERNGVQVIPHGPWHGITVAAHAHLLTGVACAPMIEYPAWRTWPDDSPARRVAELAHHGLVETPVEVRDGAITPSERPGLGLGDLQPDALEEYERLSAEVTV